MEVIINFDRPKNIVAVYINSAAESTFGYGCLVTRSVTARDAMSPQIMAKLNNGQTDFSLLILCDK